ncbi:MAG TPA: EAL domain-containing protein [Acidiferrobacterales bacterium]|nr:EAL domain-containing protein [Acidiferrobacterales bacterium]
MNNLPIRTRLLLLALAPLTIIVLLLALHSTVNRIRDLDNALRDHGQAIARQLAPACEYGVFAGNRALLNRLVSAAMRERDVSRVMVNDVSGEVLAQAENAALVGSGGRESMLVFLAPIDRSEVDIEDYGEEDGRGQSPASARTSSRRLGWVSVELSDAATSARARQILLESLVITIVGLLVTAAIAWRLGRSISEPVINLTKVVEKIRAGDLEQRVAVESGGELGSLERGINAMAEGLSAGRRREQKRAADALFQERVRAQVTLESIGDGVITTDAGGYVVYMNPVAEELTGWQLGEAEGLALAEVFRVIDERIGRERDYPLSVCLREGRIMRHESRHSLQRKDGRHFSIQDSAAPIRNQEGRIIGTVVVFHDTTEMQHLTNKMAFLASHDSLTGLLNRHEFEVRLQQVLESARTDGGQHAVCYLDLDQFKIVNDTCGHVAGDELLKQLTHQLHGKVRASDMLARLGGDEFGVILEDCNQDKAYRIADGLRQSIKDFRFAWQDRFFEIGVSIGLVPITAASGSMTEVLSAADSACYVAKDLGRNRVHIYQPNDDALARRHGEMQWVQRINDGLEENRFQLYGQHMIPLDAGAPTFCEILVRLHEEDTDLIPPNAFIPAAERYYLMPNIDRWVVARALAMLASHHWAENTSDQPVMYAINLSGQSLCDDQFLDFVVTHLRESGIPPARICFEITETAAIANLTRAIDFMTRLKDIGCRFALDDFGSGLSSFGYLKSLPVDYLKIAGNFIQDIAVDPVDHAMVDAINQIGHVMGLTTIAESVENDAILQKLRKLGVDYAQGYGISEPVPLAQLLQP